MVQEDLAVKGVEDVYKRQGEDRVVNILEEFTGKIFQTPPLHSAVKRELRVRKIYYVNILEIEGPDVLFKIGCEAGTYIRKYCHDIGRCV